MPQLRYFTEEGNRLSEAGDMSAFAAYRDSIRKYMVGKAVNAAYLEDRNGKVWNLGVLNEPYVLHTIRHKNGARTPGFNEMADRYANDIITFLVTTPPRTIEEEGLMLTLSDNIVVIYERDPRRADGYSADNRLLGLIGYPATYFITTDRVIAGVYQGWYDARSEASAADLKYRQKQNEKVLRKGIEGLLAGEEIKFKR